MPSSRVRALVQVELDGEGATEAKKSLMRWMVAWLYEHQNSAGLRDIRSRIASQLLAAESVVRHYEVLMHSRDSSVGRRRFDGVISRWPGMDEVEEERAGDAGDHDPDHGTAVAARWSWREGEVAIATAWVTPRTAEAVLAMCGTSAAAASALALPKMNA